MSYDYGNPSFLDTSLEQNGLGYRNISTNG